MIINEYVVQITEYLFSKDFAPEEDFSNSDVTTDKEEYILYNKQTGNIFVGVVT